MSEESKSRLRLGRILQYGALSLFTGMGLLATVAVAIDWLQGVDTYFWEPATCTIESSEVRPEHGEFELHVAYRYEHRSAQYTGDAYRHGGSSFDEISDAERLVARYQPGSEAPCWVDPDDPRDAYLERANLWSGFLIFLPLVFVVIGGGAIWLLHRLSAAQRPGSPFADATGAEKAKFLGGRGLLIVFFGIFFLFGAGVLIPFFVRPALQVVEARSWQPVPCEILSSDVRSHAGDDSVTYSVEALYRYDVAGREYHSNRYQFIGGSSSGYDAKADAVAGIPAGAEITCYVDPEDPFDAVIERGFTADYAFGLIPLLFALVGVGGLVVVVAGSRAIKREAARPAWTQRPFVDTREPLVLEPAMGRFAKLAYATAVALLWNGIVSVFVWQTVESWRTGGPDWLLTLFITPFVLIGLLLLSGIPFSVLALINPRPRLRLGRSAITVGEPSQIDWSFRGASHRVERLRIWLEASRTTTETVVHDSGFSISSHTDLDKTIEVLDRRTGPLDYGSAEFTLPPDAPPSSDGDSKITWKLKLHGTIAYWPDVNEEYEVRVLPGG